MVASRLKITVASSGLGHVSRGIEAWAADLGRALADRGEAVTLCKGGGRAEAAYERVIPCWQRGARKTELLFRLLPTRGSWRLGLGTDYGIEQTTFAMNLIRYLRRVRADILHVQDAHVALLIQWARRLGWVRTIPILAHGTNEVPEFQQKIAYLQHLAPWHLEEARVKGAWRPTWTAIPNFIDTATFRPGRADVLRAELRIPPDHLVVLTAAAIKRDHKRIDHLLEEFTALLSREPGLPVTLVVAGGREAGTDELIALGQARLKERVRFLVGFPRHRMPELHRLADIFVLCSLREMMPVALLEATASGRPCLVNRHPIMQWMIGPGGLAIEMASAGALAAALHHLLGDASGRARLGQQAREHCLEHFSRDRVVDQILDYYQFVAAQGRRRGHRSALGTPDLPHATTCLK